MVLTGLGRIGSAIGIDGFARLLQSAGDNGRCRDPYPLPRGDPAGRRRKQGTGRGERIATIGFGGDGGLTPRARQCRCVEQRGHGHGSLVGWRHSQDRSFRQSQADPSHKRGGRNANERRLSRQQGERAITEGGMKMQGSKWEIGRFLTPRGR